MEKKEDAIKNFKRAIESNPQLADAFITDVNTFFYFRVCIKSLGRIEEAIFDYSNAIQLNPNVHAYLHRGRY